ncbi:MAG: cupin domain-containing protein [Rhodothermales bacterium]
MGNAAQERILDFGGFPGRWEVIRSTKETAGELLKMRFEIESTTGDSPPVHIHPEAEESYEVLSGELEVKVEGEWQRVPAGEKHSVPPGTAHTFRNRVPVTLINVHKPALEFERFFRRFHKLVTEQGVNLPPRNFRSAVLMGMLFSEHEREVVSVNPPRLAMRALATIGRLLRYRLPE